MPDETVIAHEQQVKISVADLQTSGVNKISGLDTAKVRYAWFKSGNGYVRATDWKNVNLDNEGNAVITTEGLEDGTYKLAISAYDIAENAYGNEADTIVTISGDEEIREKIPYDFVEEVEKEGEEKPEDPDIVVVVGNNPPDVKDLIMKTQVGVEVSGDIDATDKDGDNLTYTLVNSGDSQYASISGDTTTFKHDTAGTYYYNVEVSDGKSTVTALVTVYVYDVQSSYRVEYYTEDLDSENYTIVDSGDISGKSGDTVNIDTTKTFEGFTYDGENSNNVLSGTVLVDGSLVLKAYYTRNSYKLVLISGDNIAGVSGAGEYKYEEEVKINATMDNDTGYDYTFENWTSGDAEYSKINNTKVTMPASDLTLKANASRTKKDAPELAIETFVKKNKDDSETIDKFIYEEVGDNTYLYVIKVENTIENSYPKAVASAVITDELPSYLEFVSGEATSGTISSGDSGNNTCTITWNAKDIGYGDDAQYAYIKVKVKKSAFKDYEETTETKNMISNIKAEVKKENLKNLTKNNTDTTAFFVRYANPVDAGVGSGYLYAGVAKTQISNIDFNRGSNYVFITKSGTNTQYTDDEINNILGSKNEERISKMLEDFVKGQANIKKYIKNLNDCSDEKIRDNVSNLYKGNVTISGTQVILWYKFIKTGDNESKKEGTKTYTITSTDDNNKESTVSCVVDYHANAYHLDGLVVDIKTLTTIPAGKPIDISNTAEIKDTGVNHMSTIKLYYESDKEDVEDVTTLELDIGEGDPVMNNEILESVSDVNKEEINQDLENKNSGDIAEIKDGENIFSGDMKTEKNDEEQQEEPKVEESSEEPQEESKIEEN